MFMVEPISIYREREREIVQLDISCARAHQFWHVIAHLCTEMGIRKSQIEVSRERNEMKLNKIEGNKYFTSNK